MRKKKKKGKDSTCNSGASQAMIELASESWRFHRNVSEAVMGMEPSYGERFVNQYNWFSRKLQAALAEAGLRLIDLTGEPYDVGLAVTALNIEDFPPEREGHLIIKEMVQPIVMEGNTVRKTGTVMLQDEEF